MLPDEGRDLRVLHAEHGRVPLAELSPGLVGFEEEEILGVLGPLVALPPWCVQWRHGGSLVMMLVRKSESG